MRKGLMIAAILAAAGIAIYLLAFRSHPAAPLNPSTATQSVGGGQLGAAGPPNASSVGAASSGPADTNQGSVPAMASTAVPAAAQAGQLVLATNEDPGLTAATMEANVERAIRQYGQMFGGNPVGTNPEITSQLLGKNPKHIDFIDPSAGMHVNDQGELVDAWGTPYFFHQLSAFEMEIHSAGPDKVMWTSDDIIVK